MCPESATTREPGLPAGFRVLADWNRDGVLEPLNGSEGKAGAFAIALSFGRRPQGALTPEASVPFPGLDRLDETGKVGQTCASAGLRADR